MDKPAKRPSIYTQKEHIGMWIRHKLGSTQGNSNNTRWKGAHPDCDDFNNRKRLHNVMIITDTKFCKRWALKFFKKHFVLCG